MRQNFEPLGAQVVEMKGRKFAGRTGVRTWAEVEVEVEVEGSRSEWMAAERVIRLDTL